MNDMSRVIIPDSSQINADELLAGPITIKIADVKIKGGKEQPVDIVIEGMEKVYRPCKSMCRVIVSAWGPDSSKYVGRSLTLFCDPKIKWGGMEVGGLRISHMSDIADDMTMALTVTRANKKPFTVRPLKVKAVDTNTGEIDAEELLNSAASLEALGVAWKSLSKADKERLIGMKDARKAELEKAMVKPQGDEPDIL
jgi:hypothetical protein